MGTLQTYMLRQLIWATLLVAAVLTCVVWLSQSLRFVDLMVNRGLSITAFVGFTLLLLPTFLSLIGPIALFVATLFTYNRMTTDSEIVIMRASGLGPLFIARPVVVLALALTIFGYVNTLYLMPSAYRSFKDLQHRFRSELSHLFLQQGAFNSALGGVTIFVRERDDRDQLYGILVHDEREPDKAATMTAQRGAVAADPPRLVLVNGSRQEIGGKSGRPSVFYFDKYTFDLGLLEGVKERLWREPRERYLDELLYPSSQTAGIQQYRKLRMEGLFRLSSPLLYLCFGLAALGFLLSGDFRRRSQLYRVLSAVAVVAAVEIAVLGAKNLGERIPQAEALIYVVPIAVTVFFAILLTATRRRLADASP